MYIHWIAAYTNHLKIFFRRTVNVRFSLVAAIDMHLGTQGVIYLFEGIKKASTACIYGALQEAKKDNR